jgi:sirohydrochlorin cobaltochelatase
LWHKSRNFFVGTVAGSPSYEDVLDNLKRGKIRKVTIAPAMLVAGDHAQNDIGGDEEDSWKEMLTAEGIKVTPRLIGLGEIEGIQRLMIDKLREAWGDHQPR